MSEAQEWVLENIQNNVENLGSKASFGHWHAANDFPEQNAYENKFSTRFIRKVALNTVP